MRKKLSKRAVLTFATPRASRGAWVAALSFLLIICVSPARAAMRALVIGVDDYIHVEPLRGAVADARDVEKALRAAGVSDMTVLLNKAATRRATLDALEDLSARARPDDAIFIALAGHGAQEPERVKGSQPDGRDAVFLLRDFNPRDASGASEKILDAEFNHYIRRLETEGGRVIFVADTCSGGGLARAVDPRGEALAYRSVKYSPIGDHLNSVADRDDAFASSKDFQHTLVLAAVDRQSSSPELRIPGQGIRGALSFAFARALEGAADSDGDGRLTADELFGYIRQVTHELSDQRQKVVLQSPEQMALDRFVVAEVTRGIAVRPFGGADDAAGGLEIRPAEPPEEASKRDQALKAAIPSSERIGGPSIKLASLDGRLAPLSDLPKVAPVTLVAPNADPDLVWDPNSQDVLAGSDVIARNISVAGLPGVIERTVILNALKKSVALHAQPIRLLPGDDLHTRGSRIEIDLGELTGRNLVLFDLTGAGEAQLLYPLGSDPAQRTAPGYTLELQVREPFGADLIVAVTADQSLGSLVDLIKKSGRRLSPARFTEALASANPQGLRVGYVGLFTTP
jgi:uncharacterized caspase-like protein